ncbi:uncharacterized protein [Spinacia oleracea]|uniref:Endonuclease/exonuclease/phosphatase domain-containing protein n=1 Tax=Spinacia oleracea TaxID=3562 RepID=A0ABM3RQ58_SPIOL|nr:uncharacterized protein LOC130471576 [Spinacia oleracea]
MGDFNSILYYDDRRNGSIVTNFETRDFEACIDSAALSKLKSCGHFYSWSNKGQGDLRISSRIGRAFGNAGWQLGFTDAVVNYLNLGFSDHSPLLMTCNVNLINGGGHLSSSIIWKTTPISCRLFKHGGKLTFMFAKLEEGIESIREELGTIQSQLAVNYTDVDLQGAEKDYTNKLKKFLHVQEFAHRKKSRIKWLQAGDSNSKFFFGAMKERQARNSIDVLYDNTGKKLTAMQEIKGEISEFYKSLIGTVAPTLIRIDVNIVRMQGVIGDVINTSHAGFIPGRAISDNSLFPCELVKCYSRKYVCPKCMIKLDLKKAYDSLE